MVHLDLATRLYSNRLCRKRNPFPSLQLSLLLRNPVYASESAKRWWREQAENDEVVPSFCNHFSPAKTI